MHSFVDIGFSKASPGLPVAHAQICPLLKRELRSALRVPLVIHTFTIHWKALWQSLGSYLLLLPSSVSYLAKRNNFDLDLTLIWLVTLWREFTKLCAVLYTGIIKILFERVAFQIRNPSAKMDCIPTCNPLFTWDCKSNPQSFLPSSLLCALVDPVRGGNGSS